MTFGFGNKKTIGELAKKCSCSVRWTQGEKMEIVRLDNVLRKFVYEEEEETGAPILEVFMKSEECCSNEMGYIRLVFRPAGSASDGNLLEMQSIGAYLRPVE